MSQDQIVQAVKVPGIAAGNGRAALELSEYGDAALVRVRGSVDATLTRNLRDSLTWAVNQHRMVLVDLSAVEDVDRSRRVRRGESVTRVSLRLTVTHRCSL
jgi:hypothetical protein